VSGIAGVLLFDTTLDGPTLLRQVLSALRHRGPDAQAFWSSGAVSLAHTLLRTMPGAVAESQPRIDAAHGLTLVMDGRLDNREELAPRLQAENFAREASDADYVLEAYRKWGEECPQFLLGDFAFAIWDAQRCRLFCVRDAMGAGPFAYVLNQRLFAFASESEALLGLPGVSGEPNEDCIAHLLVPGFVNRGDRRSWQRDVLALPAGQSLVVGSDARTRERPYWELQPGAPRAYRSDGECAEHFLAVFGTALRRRLRGAEPVSVMMSGGLDSAGIVAMLRRVLGGTSDTRFQTYSAIDDELQQSIESQAILSLAALPGAVPHFVSVPSFQGMVGLQDLYETAWSQAHPVANAILLPALMCLAASRNGARTMLLGACGDITLSAPHYYPSVLLRHGALRDAWRECRLASRNNLHLRGRSPLHILMRSAHYAFAPGFAQGGMRRLRRKIRPPDFEGSLIHPDFARRIHLLERMEQQFRAGDRAPSAEPDRVEIGDMRAGITSALSGSGQVAARHGIASRDPWADREVLEFFVRLPIRFKVRDGWTKYLLRTAFERDLPPVVRRRRDKEHLGWKITRRLMHESGPLIEHLFRDRLPAIAEYIAAERVHALYQDSLANPRPAAWEVLYELAVLILWLERVKNR
jgi:asparagine synthase (glutamine-hydrolysing)